MRNEEKKKLLANISHDLRTPLNGIIGMSNLLADSKLDADQKKLTDAIISSSNTLLTLINEILDLEVVPVQKQVAESALRSKFRVLVAEDNLINQEITLRMLKKAGYRAEVVANGKEALAAVENDNYDLILMDCQMPEMDGYEATKALRLSKYLSPIIALTANAFKEDHDRCMSVGMSDFLTKPVYLSQLIGVIDLWLGIETSA